MADSLSWLVVDATGAPRTGATPTFVDYRDRSGNARTPPTISHQGGGVYGFTPSTTDENVGAVFLVDNGAGSVPRRVSGVVTSTGAPFLGWHLEDSVGNLWAGAAPTVGLYASPNGTPVTPAPAVVAVRPYLFTLTPSETDLATDVSVRLDSPAGASPPFLAGSLEKPFGYAPAPATVRNPALDVAQFLDGKAAGSLTLALGSTLFVGFMRRADRTPSAAVFVVNTGGPPPVPYLNGDRDAMFRPTVQVMIRGPVNDLEAGETIARAVFAWLHQQAISDYVATLARDSAPAFLGLDGDDRGTWSINLELPYRSALG